MTKNIYKEFCANNPSLKQTAKATFNKRHNERDRRDAYACSMLAEAAKEAGAFYCSKMKTEKAIYYYSKAMKWYARIDDARCDAIDAIITDIAAERSIKLAS